MPKKVPKNLKVALVCDWLTELGGAEQVLRTLHSMFPEAPIYTSQYRHRVDSYFGTSLDVRTGWLNLLPARLRRYIAPLRQLYFKHLDLTDYDLVISVTGCDAKFVRTRPGAHLCYCHIPTQYYWGKYEEHLKNPGFGFLNPLARLVFRLLVPLLRKRDLEAAARPDHYVTISTYSAREIKKYYKREATVISPPVRTDLFQRPTSVTSTTATTPVTSVASPASITSVTPGKTYSKTKKGKCQAKKSEQINYTLSTLVENSVPSVRFLAEFLQQNWGRFYINFSRQVNWKNLDLLIQTCYATNSPLILIGDGPEHHSLVSLANSLKTGQSAPKTASKATPKAASKTSPLAPSEPPLVLFLPSLPQSALPPLITGARAFLFPSKEPFGIAPIEALSAGCPVVALKAGGALDYVLDGKNGIFFNQLTPNSLRYALRRFERSLLARPTPRRRTQISHSADSFSEAIFTQKMLEYIYEHFV